MSVLKIKTAEVFEPLLKPSRYKGAWGGRGSGKSHFFAEMMVEDHYRMPGLRSVCVREVQKSLKDSAKLLIEDKIISLGLGAHFEVQEAQIKSRAGGIILFQGLQDHTAESIKSLEGFHRAWIEEAQTLSHRSLTMLRPTIRAPNSEIWASWNPRLKTDAIDDFMRAKTPHNAVVVKANWRDNPWFPDVLALERKTDLEKYPERCEHIWEGDYAKAFEGAYYAIELAEADRKGRITEVDHDTAIPVHTAWDLGIGDATAIWFFQVSGGEIRVIDHYENHGRGLPHYAEVLNSKPYRYETDWVPHDAKVRELGSGRTRLETLIGLKRAPRLVADHKVMDGINAARQTLPRCWFDAERCADGIEALRQYHPDYDEKLLTFKDTPRHDWTSHSADAFRYLAMAWRELSATDKPKTDRDIIAEMVKPKTLDEMLAEHDAERDDE